MKKRVTAILLAACLALGLCACGGGSSGDRPADSSPAQSTAKPEDKPAAGSTPQSGEPGPAQSTKTPEDKPAASSTPQSGEPGPAQSTVKPEDKPAASSTPQSGEPGPAQSTVKPEDKPAASSTPQSGEPGPAQSTAKPEDKPAASSTPQSGEPGPAQSTAKPEDKPVAGDTPQDTAPPVEDDPEPKPTEQEDLSQLRLTASKITVETAEAYGVCGPQAVWLYKDGTFVVRGAGETNDFSDSKKIDRGVICVIRSPRSQWKVASPPLAKIFF